MTDLNKLRSEFESIKEIQDSIRREQLIFNTKLGCYTKKSGKMCVSANWTNGAWFLFERKAKAQAVPENHIVVPRTREVVVAIENIVQQQCDASGVQEPLHRLDGWRILEEIANKVKEAKQ